MVCLSPGWRRQVDFGTSLDDIEAALSGGDFEYYVVDLEAGDYLYLPPQWFHRVVALTPVISVNLWVPPRYNALRKIAASMQVPPTPIDCRALVELLVIATGQGAPEAWVAKEVRLSCLCSLCFRFPFFLGGGCGGCKEM